MAKHMSIVVMRRLQVQVQPRGQQMQPQRQDCGFLHEALRSSQLDFSRSGL